ncbi:MAG: sigma-70 family RNA polymerase sigma factor [Clostridia bacterium]|nr:sigma-70 family RNA polymerase sigma factor [Clostridia bacterium]
MSQSNTQAFRSDEEIVDLYFARNEQAIAETDAKYGKVCMQVSMNIVESHPDAEECVSDGYLKTWRAIPPARPVSLCAFVCRIIRNLSLNRLREMKAARRSRDLTLSFEELESCISVDESHADELPGLISSFLEGLDEIDRKLFMGRYWHATPVKNLAEIYGMTPNAVSLRLHKTRERLRLHLEEGGYTV